ncbi:unnamed protein product [Cyprideis torosa]|uniref:Uncharacterized protein n=1 Tax=Cyprideis torosa TaxID=163714 RepID=A0A7R8WMB8_9CRUS|nr:unnamed protein product [Cyprideis torosa]CAG0899156.1 unnamed protein product [Cyprideis torosa]
MTSSTPKGRSTWRSPSRGPPCPPALPLSGRPCGRRRPPYNLREFTSSLRGEGDSIYSPSVHVGGKEWRVRVRRRWGDYNFDLQCNPEERSAWSLKVDWTITALSAEGGGRNEEEKRDGEEVNREDPTTSGLLIPPASIARFLTEDTASAVNSANGPPDLKLNITPLPVGSPGPISNPFIALSKAPQCS